MYDMRKSKFLLYKVLLIVLCAVSCSGTFAHPGRTDANGGHWDRKNGTYHFHTGEYSGKSSSGSSSTSEYIPFTPPYDPPTDNPYKNNKEVETAPDIRIGIKDILENILAVAFCFWFIGLFVFSDFEETNGCLTFGILAILLVHLIGYLIEEKTELFFILILTVVILIPIVLKLKKKYTAMVTNIDRYVNSMYRSDKLYKELSQLNTQIKACENIHIPNSYEIGMDNLPKDKNSVLHWGKSFTLYKSNSGTKLHTEYNCCSATNPLHIYRCKHYCNLAHLLCKKCAKSYEIPDMSWYDDYLKYDYAKTRRQSVEEDCAKLRKEIEDLYQKCNSLKAKALIMFSKKNKETLSKANEKYKNYISVNKQID